MSDAGLMRLLPSGTTALLAELDDLEQVQGLYDALTAEPPAGVVDVVPAARTVLVVVDPARHDAGRAGRRRCAARRSAAGSAEHGELVEVPVVYDGDDLDDAAALLGCSAGGARPAPHIGAVERRLHRVRSRLR